MSFLCIVQLQIQYILLKKGGDLQFTSQSCPELQGRILGAVCGTDLLPSPCWPGRGQDPFTLAILQLHLGGFLIFAQEILFPRQALKHSPLSLHILTATPMWEFSMKLGDYGKTWDLGPDSRYMRKLELFEFMKVTKLFCVLASSSSNQGKTSN
jgi:hypothetical protein